MIKSTKLGMYSIQLSYTIGIRRRIQLRALLNERDSVIECISKVATSIIQKHLTLPSHHTFLRLSPCVVYDIFSHMN
jgi:hypothetical protein